ncbi:MAG: LysM peptidoglycan-binding domain-containing protein [Proteobacteria bacterium]|nr:LysM peptidoglycan-binding domain-containing protein [Pseudomonadota bacterium]
MKISKYKLFSKIFLSFVVIITLPLMVRGEEYKEHIVRKGDTLWSLSEKYKKDPYKWINIWKLNPKVTDPHWIYPGWTLRIYKDQIVIEKKQEKAEVKEEQVIPEPKVEVEEKVIYEEKAREVGIEEKKEEKEKVKKFVLDLRELDRLGFIFPKEVDSKIKILTSVDTNKKLGESGTEYFIDGGDINSVSLNDVYTIIRYQKDIVDELTQRFFGKFYIKIGKIKITEVYPNMSVGRVIKSYREINEGDILIKEKDTENYEIVLNKSEVFLEGRIIGGVEQSFFISDKSFVFIDKGSLDGLTKGNILKIEKMLGGKRERYLDLGRMVVVKTWDNISCAYVIEIRDIVEAGYRFSTF